MPINKNTFCALPWYGIYVGPNKKLMPCCEFSDETTYDYNQIKKYFTSKEIRNLRNDLLNGVKNKKCSTCWNKEKAGNESLRLISNNTIASVLGKEFHKQVEDPKVSNINTFDLTLGNLCNLKCVMCRPEESSQLLAEATLNPSLKQFYKKDQSYDQSKYNWPKNNDFIKWCNKYSPNLIHLKMTGGEPFIIPWVDDVINKIPDVQKSKCILHFTTNLTVFNKSLFNKFKKFKEVWLSVSCEGTGVTHEYMRYGHKWAEFKDILDKILQLQIKNLIVKINHVVQAPSYHSIINMTSFFDDRNLLINPIKCTRPKHFGLSALSEKCKEKFVAKTKHYKGFNIKFIDYVRKLSIENMKQDKNLTNKCRTHLEFLDRARKNDYKQIIPVENF